MPCASCRATTSGRPPTTPIRSTRRQRWADQGAEWLHVVDLDGARSGASQNLEHVRRIADETDAKVQMGGGLRDAFAVERALNAGAERVVIGTAALADPEFLEDMLDDARPASRRRRRRPRRSGGDAGLDRDLRRGRPCAHPRPRRARSEPDRLDPDRGGRNDGGPAARLSSRRSPTSSTPSSSTRAAWARSRTSRRLPARAAGAGRRHRRPRPLRGPLRRVRSARRPRLIGTRARVPRSYFGWFTSSELELTTRGVAMTVHVPSEACANLTVLPVSNSANASSPSIVTSSTLAPENDD